MTRRSKTKIRVLLVDDSAISRKLTRRMLEGFSDIEIVGEAAQPYAAMEILVRPPRPDVMLLDLEMPQMDGLTFLKLMMRTAPMPIVIFSAIASPCSKALVEALAAGAIDVIRKPAAASEFKAAPRQLHDSIVVAAGARIRRPPRRKPAVPVPALTPAPSSLAGRMGAVEVIAIGSSTGGPQALKTLLPRVPHDSPPILLVQHMPTAMTPAFVTWMDSISPLRVTEAADRATLSRGTVSVGSGARHLRLERRGSDLVSRLSDDPPGGLHRPSVDVLFESVAAEAGRSALGVILSGMGRDGAKGLLAMRESGAHTVAQDEASCVVYGMPGESERLGAVCEILRLDEISDRIKSTSRGGLQHART